MKKILLIIPILLLCTFSCKCNKDVPNLDVKEIEPISTEPVKEDDSVEKTLDNYEVIEKYLATLNNLSTYTFNETGKTEAKKGIINYTQEITAQTKKLASDEYYYHNQSSSTLVKTDHTANFKGENVKYHDKDEDEKEVSLKEYRSIYGTTPNDFSLYGFIISKEAIKNIEREKVDDNYKFTIQLDGEIAGTNTKIQMKKFGNLSDYPIYSSVEIVLYLQNDFLPIKLELHSVYDISVFLLGSMTCNQNLVDEVSDIKRS